MNSFQCILNLSVRQPVFVSHQGRLRDNVISEFAFMRAICIASNDFFPAAWTYVMGYFVFSDYDRLWFGNFLDNLRFKSKRKVKLCSAIRTSIGCNLHLAIRDSQRSGHTFMPDLLAGLSLVGLILFEIAATSKAWRSMGILVFS